MRVSRMSRSSICPLGLISKITTSRPASVGCLTQRLLVAVADLVNVHVDNPAHDLAIQAEVAGRPRARTGGTGGPGGGCQGKARRRTAGTLGTADAARPRMEARPVGLPGPKLPSPPSSATAIGSVSAEQRFGLHRVLWSFKRRYGKSVGPCRAIPY